MLNVKEAEKEPIEDAEALIVKTRNIFNRLDTLLTGSIDGQKSKHERSAIKTLLDH